MSWISKEHKILYSKAIDALCNDLKSGSSSLIDETGKVLSAGYDKVKNGINYINKQIRDNNGDNNNV